MCKENIDYKRLCDAIGITEGIAKEFAKMECISTLVDDIYTYANYEEIAMDFYNGSSLVYFGVF